MALGVLVQWRKHDWENDLHVITDKIAEILVVPEVERSFCDLEMRAGDRFGQLVEQGLLNLGELGRIHDLKNVFNLVEEHDLLGAVDLGPISQETEYDLSQQC